MFGRYVATLTVCWLALVAALFGFFYRTSPQTMRNYHKLMQKSDQAKSLAEEQSQVTQQARHQISKQVLYKKGEQRLQMRLFGDSSKLVFDPQASGAQLVERFDNLTCLMQEDLSYTKNLQAEQFLRYLHAQGATYYYQTGILEAQDVELARYLLPGHEWSTTWPRSLLLMQGQAKKVQLSLFFEPSLQAQGFQATLSHWGN